MNKSLNDILYSNHLYDHNLTTIKSYGDISYRVANITSCRKSGLEDKGTNRPKGTVNSKKLRNNIARVRSRVYELAMCNDWEYFVTLTIAPDKCDRYDLKAFYKRLSKFINNYNRNCDEDCKLLYLLIPEQHKDGAWHLHGLLKGIRKEDIKANANGYLTWSKYDKTFGYMSMDTLKSKEACSKYILKYITKELEKSVSELNNHMYYCSKGLKKAHTVFKGVADYPDDWVWDYETENGYCRIKTLSQDKLFSMDLDKFLVSGRLN